GACGNVDLTVDEAQARGAVGVLLDYSVLAIYQAGEAHTVPVYVMLNTDSAPVRTGLQAGAGPVNATLVTTSPLMRDGALDNATVAHEWGHYLSNRLIGNASGLTTNQSRGMGEGWSDFGAMLLIVRPEDAAVPSNANWAGSFGNNGYDEFNS